MMICSLHVCFTTAWVMQETFDKGVMACMVRAPAALGNCDIATSAA